MDNIPALARTILRFSQKYQKTEDLDPLIDFLGNKEIILLGEASHGTEDFYAVRAEISRRLISEKGFNFIAVEGDWPDVYQINRYLRNLPDSGENGYEVLRNFSRWPTWMWANGQVLQFIEWLRQFNFSRNEKDRIGFYGLDLYSLWQSISEVIDYLAEINPQAQKSAIAAYLCFDRFQMDASTYALTSAVIPDSCKDEVVQMLADLVKKRKQYQSQNAEDYFNAEQNALVAKNAENYYSQMVEGGATTWNIRDRHMFETVKRLKKFWGKNSKAIVWAHNTHVGDARYTDMKRIGMLNLGLLLRDEFGKDKVGILGFATFAGDVIASYEWGSKILKLTVPEAREESWERIFHQIYQGNRLFIFTDEKRWHLSSNLMDQPDMRAIGVVYDPSFELGNYAPTDLQRCFDAFIFLDQTKALLPLNVGQQEEGDFPETYPLGV